MTHFKKTLLFLFILILSALLLSYLDLGDSTLRVYRFEKLLEADTTHALSGVPKNCDQIKPLKDSIYNVSFQNILTRQLVLTKDRLCQFEIQSAQAPSRLFNELSLIHIRVFSPNGELFIDLTQSLEIAKPLCLIPILALIFALLLDIKGWGLGVTLVSLLFSLSSLNLLQSFRLLFQSIGSIFSTDSNFMSFFLLLFWFSLHQSRQPTSTPPKAESTALEKFLNRFATSLVGLWNPIAYTLTARLFVLKKNTWIKDFLDAQVLLSVLGIYIFSYSLGLKNGTEVWDVFLLPRYFTFMMIVSYLIHSYFNRAKSFPVIWKFKELPTALLIIGIIEITAFFFRDTININSLTRISLGLILNELFYLKGIDRQKYLSYLLPKTGILLIGFSLPVLLESTGLIDMFLLIGDPHKHPHFFTPFTYLTGIGLGVITGSFSAAFFPMLIFMKWPQLPLVQSALLDGILVGYLLSPFSLLNLLCVSQFEIPLRKLFLYRIQQLAIPGMVGLTIYAVGSIGSLNILRPASFVFCCLVALALELRQRSWLLRQGRTLLSTVKPLG